LRKEQGELLYKRLTALGRPEMKRIMILGLLTVGFWAGEGWGQLDSVWSRQFTFDDFVWASDVSEINDGRIFISVTACHWEEHQGQVNDRTGIFVLDSLGNDVNQFWFEPMDASLALDDYCIIKGRGDIKCLDYEGRVLFDLGLPQDAAGFDCEDMLAAEDSVLFMVGSRHGLPTVSRMNLSNGNYVQRDIAYMNRGIAMLGEFKSFVKSSDGGFVAVGNTLPDSGNWSNQDIWIARFNEDLEINWTRREGSDNFDQGKCVIDTRDTCFVIAGGYDDADGEGVGWLLKIDNSGNRIWSRNLVRSRILRSVVQTSLGGFIAVGTDGPNWSPAVLFKVSPQGRSLSRQNIQVEGICEIFTEVSKISDGSYLVIGQGSGFASKSILFKFTQPNSIIAEDEIKMPSGFELSAFPNPFNGRITIAWNGPSSGEATLRVHDVLGREACLPRFIPANSGQIVWDAQGHPAGKYVIYLQTAGNSSHKTITLLK
jgi:hypothetical protein